MTIARKKPIARSSPKRTRRTAAGQRKKFEREFGGQERHDWVEAQPSVASGKGPCVNAHVVKGDGGMSYKASARFIAPLTDFEHIEELHRYGPQWFEAKYGLDLAACAADTGKRWLSHLGERGR